MKPSPIQPTRIQALNGRRIQKGRYVLYWMQQSQRAEYNHALEYAIQQANALGQGVLVGFGLMDDYPEANVRHYTFMLEGLQETQATLAKQGIKMVVQKGSPPEIALSLGTNASLIVCDRGYLRHQKAWRTRVARSAACAVVQVESDVVVPIEIASVKAEYAARTIRPRIHRHLDDYLMPFRSGRVKKKSLDITIDSLDLTHIDALVRKLSLDQRVTPVSRFFKGGTTQARARFDTFIQTQFHRYVENRNQPRTDDVSHMSPYLHFGQISPLYLALRVKAEGQGLGEAQEAYLEELIIRRELAMNFAHYNPKYDAFACLPQWARTSLKQHQKDPRQSIYTRSQLENANTHDPYWNAAMQEMKITGFMHNYMRMYWGKKILEWSRTPAHAFRTTLAINNTYFLDGRDPNSYAGVAWIFGMHDRAWFERPIFGKVRYMAASGLERKCDIQGYVDNVQSLETG
jgi:deoxyribodipyrimidine photo-lyase